MIWGVFLNHLIHKNFFLQMKVKLRVGEIIFFFSFFSQIKKASDLLFFLIQKKKKIVIIPYLFIYGDFPSRN